MKALQETIMEMVPIMHICAKSKCWWTKELMQLYRKANKLGRLASKLNDYPYHKIHTKHADIAKLYHSMLKATKQRY